VPALKIHVTYQCTAQCDHCHLRAGRTTAPAIDGDLAMRVIRDLRRLNGLSQMVLLGGEPGLFPELVHRLCGESAAMGIWTRVETNTSWAVSEEAAMKFFEPLAAIRTQIMMSVDAFHDPFIPVSRVACAIKVIEKLGNPYSIEVPYMEPAKKTHPLDVRTDELLAELTRLLGHEPTGRMARGRVYFKGRGAHKLAPLVCGGRGVPAGVCNRVPWWTDGQQNTTQLFGLDPDGYLSKECGIAIGNVKERTVEEIFSTFDAERHPILSKLIHAGPLGLAQEAKELGYTLKKDYADKCHLCQEAREVLRARYPQYLTPAQQYVD
jgi:hypothetical protein